MDERLTLYMYWTRGCSLYVLSFSQKFPDVYARKNGTSTNTTILHDKELMSHLCRQSSIHSLLGEIKTP